LTVVIPDSLVALAEDPEFFIDLPDGAERLTTEHYCVTLASDRRWAGVCRLRMPVDHPGIERIVQEIRELVEGVEAVTWNVSSSAEPADLPERLRALGLRDPDPPLDPLVAAMALAHEPPGAEGIDVTPIETLEEHVAGIEIMVASDGWSESAAEAERARAAETFERRRLRGGLQWLAWIDSSPVAWAAAERSDVGLYLAGGATLSAARGRGCYRALVRARWDEAVRRHTPALAVQSQYGSSAPILRRLGFTEVATVHTLQ
jgi:hypothetical protein